MMEKKLILGIGLNYFDAQGILLDSEKKVIVQINKKWSDVTANNAIQVILELCEELNSKAKKIKGDILGIGLALGGIVDKRRGMVYWPQRENSSYVYVSIPLKKYLQDKFKLPVVIENDANACVWAEHMNNFPDNKNVIYMISGVGCGLLLNGSIFRGRDGAAGEVFINYNKMMTSYLGDFSFLKPWPIDLEVVKRIKESIALGKDTSLIKGISSTGRLGLEKVFYVAKGKDRLSRKVLKDAAFLLGVKASLLINLFNPEVIIIGGGFEEAEGFFLDELNKAVKKFSFSEMRKELKIGFSKLGRLAAPLGAALIASEENSLHS